MAYSYFSWLQGFYQTFEQFGALYMLSLYNKYPVRPGFEPGTLRLQAPVNTKEPSRSARIPVKNVGTLLA